MRRSNGQGEVRALDIGFDPAPDQTCNAFRVGRCIPSGEDERSPLTFEEMAEQADGDHRLAVLKADVDGMGVKVGQIVNDDTPAGAPYQRLQTFSRNLHTFFVERVQDLLQESWPLIYNIYAGGDDLLLVGPWDVMLDFAGALAKEFAAGPGREYAPLTLSAGIAQISYRAPIRHSVESGEELLEQQAKKRDGKNSCAALGSVWAWGSHDTVIDDGKKLAQWTGESLMTRSLLHRLLGLVESNEPARMARWSYQIHRNVRDKQKGGKEPLDWATEMIDSLEGDEQRAAEAAASIRYALLATWSR